MSAREGRQLLLEGAAELRLDLGAGRAEALLELAGLLVAWGGRINLTGHRDQEAVVRGLVLEAGALLVHAPEFSSLADLGSGAGFPGLPIAVLRPDVEVTLVESRLRRHHFQRAAIRELGLAKVRPLRGRAEVLAPTPHQAVVAQAMARPARALGWGGGFPGRRGVGGCFCQVEIGRRRSGWSGGAGSRGSSATGSPVVARHARSGSAAAPPRSSELAGSGAQGRRGHRSSRSTARGGAPALCGVAPADAVGLPLMARRLRSTVSCPVHDLRHASARDTGCTAACALLRFSAHRTRLRRALGCFAAEAP
jgi:16S rRNA (guanine527-N7)-methyltransferase